MPQWRELYDRFDPEEPATQANRAQRPHSPVAAVARRLDKQLAEDRVLLVGTRGNGKTTELLRLADERSAREFVVFLDLVRHFDEVVADLPALEKIRAWEVCFLAGVAVWRAAEEALGHRWPQERARQLTEAWQRARDASRDGSHDEAGTKLDIAKLAQTMIIAASPAAGAVDLGLKLLHSALGDVNAKWTLPIGSGARPLPDQHGAMQALLACVNQIIADVQTDYHRRVLLVIDGLDRVDDEHVRSLFVDSQMLARFACPTVLCAPNLRHNMHAATLRFRCEVLVNEPVLDHADPTREGPGIAFFRDVFAQRVRGLDLGPGPADALLNRLAYCSGGQVRMFIKLVRGAAEAALLAEAPALTAEHVDAALREQRRLLEMGLHRGHTELLQQVADDPKHRLPDSDRVWDLLAKLRLLPYPNDSEWYYPHPLLSIRPGSQRGVSG